MRTAEINRKTRETDVSLSVALDGAGVSEIKSGNGFFDHMLTLFSKHGGFDISLSCAGDVEVDFHHSAEDIGICLGKAFRQALGDCRGIKRYGSVILPMDEALVMTAVDISGRGFSDIRIELPSRRVGDFDTELVSEFFTAFAREAALTLHVRQLAGLNTHHIIECCFKSAARALREACSVDGSDVPSTKGVI
ncbi:MAG: imidazoleglycerol-phosphate dehydratase HisB [Clostridia bacterium]|nr:imidazoleglycerol-phosphate dehydratase HisB [Clostridia bacterium]MBR5768029.1 imidazoleglycerol-phosphate dehydratase HisB [Clostridia bacterium]